MNRISKILAAAVLAASAASFGCGILYTNVSAPHSYRSATPGDVKTTAADETVTGSGCARSVLYLFAWGDAGYAAAIRDALRDRASAILYDVRTDLRLRAYALGAYTESCTIVTGKLGHL
jgi:hypothetical protein